MLRLTLVLILCIGGAGPAAAELGWFWRAIGLDDGEPAANQGFAAFAEEFARIEERFACSRVAEGRTEKHADRRRHCILGGAGTVRITLVQPVGYGTLTKAVQLVWADANEGGEAADHPPHADRVLALETLDVLARLYLPSKAATLQQLFEAARNGSATEGSFTAVVAHFPGVAQDQRVVEFRDGNYAVLGESETRQARAGYDTCLGILRQIDLLEGLEISGEPVPERQPLYAVYFLSAERGDKFLCELHYSGYYRIRVSPRIGEPFRTLAHGNIR